MLIVVEDYISAIKVARSYVAAPLLGATMSLQQIKEASDKFSSLGVWLDRDKAKESALIALRASQYVPVFIVSSSDDPKKYADEVISELIEEASYKTLYKDQLTQDKKMESPEEEEKRRSEYADSH